ncbi:hypothetical protein HYW60_02505 [Candidatus Kaiserbacteria bacterium]|nr:hypothetical protein [Candidatus Kaiserbacteria bacterium]
MGGCRTLKTIFSSILYTPYAILLLPSVALAAPNTFQELAYDVVEILDTATFTLIIFGLVVYFWGMATNIPHFGDEKGAEKRKSFFFWGLVVLFVMASIWGIIHLLQNTLFGGDSQFTPGAGESATLCDNFGNCSVGRLEI